MTINRNKTIDTTSIALVQIAQKQKQREEKLAREMEIIAREEKIETVKDILKLAFISVSILVGGYIALHIGAHLALLIGGVM